MIDKSKIRKLFFHKIIHNKYNDSSYQYINSIIDRDFYISQFSESIISYDPVEHYIQIGWKEGKNAVDWFSVSDYLDMYPDIAKSTMEPLSHYLRHGQHEGRIIMPAPGSERRSQKDFLENTGLRLTRFPEQFEAGFYAMAAGIEPATRWQALAHFINVGVFQPRLFAIFPPDPALLVMAGQAVENQNRHRAFKYFKLAERQGSTDPRAFHSIADHYLNEGQLSDARDAYRRSIELGGNHYWTFRNLGITNSRLGYFDDAIVFLKKALDLKPENTEILLELQNVAKEIFHIDWNKANGLAFHGRDSEASFATNSAISTYRLNTNSTDLISVRSHKSRKDFMPKIAIFGSDSIAQCTLYRISQKIDQFGEFDICAEFYALDDYKNLSSKLFRYDVLIVYRAPAIPEVIDILVECKKFDICTFYDIDDLIFDEDCYPPDRADLKGMVSPAEYAGLVTGRTLFREAMALCDYGIASTPPLVNAIATIVQKGVCFLSRNALAQAHYTAIERQALAPQRPKKSFVFFYGSGSRSHNKNFAMMASGLSGVLRRHRNVELHVIGPVELGPEFDGLQRQIHRLPFTSNVADYWHALSDADVNLAPLTSGPFNDGKSEIKWLEAAMLSICSIVSSSGVYDSLIQHGVDGYIAKNEEEWADALERVVSNRHDVKAIGRAARDRVLSEYGLHSGGQNLLSIIIDGWQRSGIAEELPAKSKPRVLIVNIFYPPQFTGGATRVVQQSVEDLTSSYGADFELEVFCGREPDYRPGSVNRYFWNGVLVTSLSPFVDHDSIERSVDTAEFFTRYLEMWRPDLIHFHCIQRLGASLLDVAASLHIPHVVSAHDGWWISDNQFLIDDAGVPVFDSKKWGDPRRIERLRIALNRATSTLAVSKTQADLYQSRGITNVQLLPNGSETMQNVASAPLDGPVWLGLLGGLGVAKGAELLKQVLMRRRYQNLKFLLVDHTMLEGTVRYEQWGTNEVELIGKASFANVANIYTRLHAVLATSLCIESFGLVAREATRLGRWVIASNRGGMSEDVIEGINGHIIDPSTPTSLIHVLDMIEANPDKYRVPPSEAGSLRGRSEVAADLASLYTKIITARDET